MIFFRPKPPKPQWKWRFVWCRRIGDHIVILQWLRVRYEECDRSWTYTWHWPDLDGDPLFVETGDVPVF